MLREGHCRLDGVSTSGERSEWRAGMPVNWEDFGFAGRPGFGWRALDLAGGRWCIERALIWLEGMSQAGGPPGS